MLLWNGLLVLFVLLAGFPWNMARPQLHLLSLTVKKLRCQASYSILRSQNLQYKTHSSWVTYCENMFNISIIDYPNRYCWWLFVLLKSQRMGTSNLMLMLISWTWGCTTFHNFISMFKKKDQKLAGLWLAGEWLIMSGYMDLRRPRVYRRSNVGLVTSDLLTTMNNRHVSHVWHHQRDVSYIWFHWWCHKGDFDHG